MTDTPEIDLSQLPEAVREEIQKIDRDVAEWEASALEISLMTADALKRRSIIARTAAAFLETVPMPTLRDTLVADARLPLAEARPSEEPRARRNIRAEVLAFLIECGRAVTVAEIVRALSGDGEPPVYLSKSVEKALEYHHREMRIDEVGEKWLIVRSAAPIPFQEPPPDPPTAYEPVPPLEAISRREKAAALLPDKTPAEALEAIARAGDMGLGSEQCARMRISDAVLDQLFSAEMINHEGDRYVLAPAVLDRLEDAGVISPLNGGGEGRWYVPAHVEFPDLFGGAE